MATTTATAAPAGPPGHWLAGNLPAFARDRLGFFDDCFRRYGDYVDGRLGPRRFLIVNHPDQVEEVLVAKNRSFRKHFVMRRTRRTLGNGLLTSEGDFWRRQRKLAQPAFHRDRLAHYARVMVDDTERMLAGWADGQARDAHDDMTRLTLQIVAKCLFDADVAGDAAEASEAMETVLHCFSARIGRLLPIPDFIPTPTNRRLDRAVRRLERLIFDIIAQRRDSREDRGDLLSTLIQARDEDDGSRMTDRQLRDEVMTLFMAGHETTANTLAWAWYLLANHPEAEARLHAEVDAAVGERPPTVADLHRLPFVEAVVNETLRLYPTVWLQGREAIEPVAVGTRSVAKGTTVYMSQWVVHRDPRWFDQPLAFRPDRWLDGLGKRLHRYAYFPFGGGPRLCIGNHFAQMEAGLILATVARRYRLRLASGAEVVPVPTMTLRPAAGVPVVLERRPGPGLA